MAIEVTDPAVRYVPIKSKRFICSTCIQAGREAFVIEHTPVLRHGMGRAYQEQKRRQRNMALMNRQSIKKYQPKVWMECPNGCHRRRPWLVRDLLCNPKKDVAAPKEEAAK